MPDDGVVIIPRRLGFWAMAGGVVYLLTTTAMGALTYSGIKSDIAALERQDAESRGRGDDVRRRLSELEANRNNLADRLTRVEERITTQTELLREIRDELKKRPDR
jgi:chromosome segregation ATPase